MLGKVFLRILAELQALGGLLKESIAGEAETRSAVSAEVRKVSEAVVKLPAPVVNVAAPVVNMPAPVVRVEPAPVTVPRVDFAPVLEVLRSTHADLLEMLRKPPPRVTEAYPAPAPLDLSPIATAIREADTLSEITRSNPLPVIAVDEQGRPMIMGGGGGIVIDSPLPGAGMLVFRSIDLDETEEEVKASAGKIYGWYLFNAATSVRYLKLYNATAANVTVGTTTPFMTIPIPAEQAANVEFTNGITFSTALTAAATTGLADSDTGAPGANEVVANLLYK